MPEVNPSVYFIGSGPGDPELLTLKAARIIRTADVIIYADSLVNPEITKMARPEAKIYTSADRSLDEITEIMVPAARQGKTVARLQSGDPALYGAIREQMAALRAHGVTYAVIPGVSSLFAAAAQLGVELTAPGLTQTVIVTRRAGRTPVPEAERLTALAAHGATLAIFLSVPQIVEVCADLLAAGNAPETPVRVVYRASWPDEAIVSGDLTDIAAKVEAAGIQRQALILIGAALDADGGEASKLYDAHFSHGYREAAA
jgi:precorrin-4/cobalt-precorrin-4 C11-methyltransferase